MVKELDSYGPKPRAPVSPSPVKVQVSLVSELDENLVSSVKALIGQALEEFGEESSSVTSSVQRRLNQLEAAYGQAGSFLVLAMKKHIVEDLWELVGVVGVAPMAGLPFSEGFAEFRDLVVSPSYRSKGVGRLLLSEAMNQSKKVSYGRVYLETTPKMQHAKKLFKSLGFVPVKDKHSKSTPMKELSAMPAYFVLEHLS